MISPQSLQIIASEVVKTNDYHIQNIKQNLSQWIIREMEKAGMTKAELADRLEVSRPYVTKMLKGNVNFTLGTIVKVARVFGAKVDISFTDLRE